MSTDLEKLREFNMIQEQNKANQMQTILWSSHPTIQSASLSFHGYYIWINLNGGADYHFAI